MSSKKSKKAGNVRVEYTDIVHEMRNGVLCDVYLNREEEVKVEVSREE